MFCSGALCHMEATLAGCSTLVFYDYCQILIAKLFLCQVDAPLAEATVIMPLHELTQNARHYQWHNHAIADHWLAA